MPQKDRLRVRIINYEKYLLIESGIKGGICQSVLRYAEANNKYMKNYNKDIKSSFLECYDASNLYGWAICKKSPKGTFRWTTDL